MVEFLQEEREMRQESNLMAALLTTVSCFCLPCLCPCLPCLYCCLSDCFYDRSIVNRRRREEFQQLNLITIAGGDSAIPTTVCLPYHTAVYAYHPQESPPDHPNIVPHNIVPHNIPHNIAPTVPILVQSQMPPHAPPPQIIIPPPQM
eukprot:GHVR01119523.1.p1 GENE.GHVR01119523.1~~GHVR01119523.1.p1  ORF type:complete len:147 (+),score=18.48 GHVR01119523.1:34-474(+)